MKKAYLKRKLKKVYLEIEHGFQEYDCGHKMLLNINSRYYDLCVKFNKTADKLSELDKDCPRFRYELF